MRKTFILNQLLSLRLKEDPLQTLLKILKTLQNLKIARTTKERAPIRNREKTMMMKKAMKKKVKSMKMMQMLIWNRALTSFPR